MAKPSSSLMAKPSVTIGGKGSSLSSASLYSVSRSLSNVSIDTSALHNRSNPQDPNPNPIPNPNRISGTLTLEFSRATLTVLLNHLILSNPKSALPILIARTLNSNSDPQTLDLGMSLDEIGAVELIAICGILDCCCSALVRVCDAVAAVSCEVARANVAAFDLPVLGDGFSIKDETDVAADLKVFLFGSKLVGNLNEIPFGEIPSVHGSFREAVRSLHRRVRVELNSKMKVSFGKEKSLVSTVLSLAASIKVMGESSLGRSRLVFESFRDAELRSKVVEVFDKGCSTFDSLRDRFSVFSLKIASGKDYVEAFCGVYDLFVNLREILAWEAALSLFSIEMDESIDKGQVGNLLSVKATGENVKGEKKSEKKKKKTLGKGTSVVRQLLRDRLRCESEDCIGNPMILVEWSRELSSYFDPKDAELDILLTKLKEIVESNEVRRLPKIPKGTRDFGKEQMAIRERAFSIITNVFKKHGAVALDTPVFELRETLMGKYGEDSKLIYDLADQGGELCSLRYDLTVPFARYLAMNNITALKRYQIAKVYRRDNPSKGRYREFYQCDLDIAGQHETMEPDFEVVKVLTELLDELNIGDYEIKLNHRKLLDGMLEICGVSSEKFRTVCSSIDKLDKQSFEQIKKELVEEKGLAIDTAEKIGSFVKKRGPPLEILSNLKVDGSQFMENTGSVTALQELEILFKALEKSKCLDKVVFDLSLARGLDYYTGVIFEAVFKGATQVGSIAAGGRYDNLVGMFSGKLVPAVGVSLGIERVFTIMEQLEKDRDQVIRATETQVLVAVLVNDLSLAAEMVSELWDVGIKAEFGMTKRVMNHINRAKQSGIPWMVLVGQSEIDGGVVKIKNIDANKEDEVPRDRIVQELQKRLNIG